MVLPLGDFSLITDLPLMYHSYSEVTAEEPNVIDFIGDYILCGKELLGHNKQDATPKPNGSNHFQHHANCFLYCKSIGYIPITLLKNFKVKPFILTDSSVAYNYQKKFLRPPIIEKAA